MGVFVEIPINNPSFETGDFTGWTVIPGSHLLFSVSTVDGAHTGTYSCRHVCPFAGNETTRIRQTITDYEQYKGKVIRLSLWSKMTNYGSGDYLWLRIWDGTPGAGYVQASFATNEVDWTQRALQYTFPTNATQLIIEIGMNNVWPNPPNPYGSFDDIVLEYEKSTFVLAFKGFDVRGDEIQAVFSTSEGVTKPYRSPNFGDVWYASGVLLEAAYDIGFDINRSTNSLIGGSDNLYTCTTTSGTAYTYVDGADIVSVNISRIDVNMANETALIATGDTLYKTVDWGMSAYNLLDQPIIDVAFGGAIPIPSGA